MKTWGAFWYPVSTPKGTISWQSAMALALTLQKVTQRYMHQKLWIHGKTFGWLKVRFIEKGHQVKGWVFSRYTTSTPCA